MDEIIDIFLKNGFDRKNKKNIEKILDFYPKEKL